MGPTPAVGSGLKFCAEGGLPTGIASTAREREEATAPAELADGYGVYRAALESRRTFDFVVRTVRTERQLDQAVALRRQCYDRQFPELSGTLGRAEAEDFRAHSVVLVAVSKATALPVGTVRIESSLDVPFYPAEHYDLPAWLAHCTVAFVTRLAVRTGREGRHATELLLKAVYRYCLATGHEWIVATARPPRDRLYQAFGCEPLPGMPPTVSLPGHPQVRLRMMGVEVFELRARWQRLRHPYFDFLFRDPGSDIEIFSSVKPAWTNPRADHSTRPESDGDPLGMPVV